MQYIEGTYNPALVVLSVSVAILSAYVALDLVSFAWQEQEKRHIKKWLAISAVALGLGIWTMHFIGMYALQLPLTIRYDAGLTLLSLLLAILAAFLGLFICHTCYTDWRISIASICMGAGITSMHYLGMFAIHINADMHYNRWYVALSVVIAMSASWLALFLMAAMKTGKINDTVPKKILIASILGVAVSGMHYMGMAATRYTHSDRMIDTMSGFVIAGELQLTLLAVAAGVLLMLPLFSTYSERRWSRHLASEAESLRISEMRMQTLIENVADAIIVIDRRGRIIIYNSGARRLFGYSSHEVMNKNISLLMPEPDRGAHDAYMQRYLRTGITHVINTGPREITALHKNGKPIPIEITVSDAGGQGEARQFVAVMRDISALKLEMDRLAKLANYDPLTGLFNRNMLWERLRHGIDISKRSNNYLCVMYMDLDGFKQVNDTLGHDIGDKLLKTVAALLKNTVRDSDTVARLGGDEFCIVMESMADSGVASRIAAKLISAFARPLPVLGLDLNVTASLGIALYPLDGQEPEELLKHADTAMYAAKQQGKNQYKLFSEIDKE